MSYALQLAEAVAEHLQAGTFPVAFAPRVMTLPEFDLSTLSDVQVTVVPPRVQITPDTRDALQLDYDVVIGVQKKCDSPDIQAVKAELGLAEQIALYFGPHELPVVRARWVRTEQAPLYLPDHLEKHRVLTSIVTVTYRRWHRWPQ